MTRIHWLSLAAMALGGCALTSKGETLDPHFFTPESVAVTQAAAGAPKARGPLRLGRVRGAVSIKEKIIFRESVYEVGYYEERRWTEKPDVYLRRALAQALFEEAGFAQTASGTAPTLEAELFAFEEIRGPKPFVRVGLTILLREDDAALMEKTLVVEEPIVTLAGDAPTTPLVRAFSLALTRTVSRTVDETSRGTASLASSSSAAATAAPK